jgi:glycosyltransferase involved in cell wall biosynthesis
MFQASDITLYVPCYNAQSSIDACIEGVLAQTIRPGRFVVVDDGSTIPFSRPSIEVLRHAANRGLATARSTALAQCQTPLIASLDADVVVSATWLETMLAGINSGQWAGVGGAMRERHQERLADRWRGVHMAQHWGDQPVRNPRFLYGSNTLFRVDAIRAAGGYDQSLKTNNEDRTISEALYRIGHELLYVPAARCEHLRTDTSATVLRTFWQWHHTAGISRGEFASASGLISRIRSVAFGIFEYRYGVDEAARRTDFLALDMCLPWVFSALDLQYFRRTTGRAVPTLAENGEYRTFPDPMRTLLQGIAPVSGNDGIPEPWWSEYRSEYTVCLDEHWRARSAACRTSWDAIEKEATCAVS